MGLISKYIGHANLENRKQHCLHEESEDYMPRNNSKIRREVKINGEAVWITANSEQEYADKLIRITTGDTRRSSTKHLFRDYAERWFEVFSKPNVSNVTAITYRRQLDLHIYPVLGSFMLEDIDTALIQSVFNRMGDSVAAETKAKVKNVLNQIFETAIDENLIYRNPLRSNSIKMRGREANTTEPYSVSDMKYFVSHLNDIVLPYDRAFLALSVCLPLRQEEVLGLQWKNLDEDLLTLYVRSTITHPDRNAPRFNDYTKTSSSRRDLVFPESLLQYLPERGDDEDFVIGGKHPISYTGLRFIRKRIARDIGYSGSITPRRFRTTVATDISDITHDLKLVQKMLGHSTPQMTLKHYDKGRSTSVDATNAIERCYGFVDS